MRALVVVFGLLVLGALTGCGEGEQKRFRVSGKVTFDGKEIPYGPAFPT